MFWDTLHHRFDLTHRGVIMGVLNVTPDSFSDGGSWMDLEAAVQHGKQMIEEGAEIIDVGGESTRPGATPVSAEEELRRVLPVIEELKSLTKGPRPVVLSIDTMKAEVARAAVYAGAGIINDVSGLREVEMLQVIRETGAGTIVMHMQGEPQTMQREPQYGNVVAEIREFFRQTASRCLASGVPQTRFIFDPGIGFGKNLGHNLSLLKHVPELSGEGRPLMIGVGRKSFIGKVIGSDSMEDRAWPTVALTAHARSRGARVFRVHEVKHNVEALRMAEAMLG